MPIGIMFAIFFLGFYIGLVASLFVDLSDIGCKPMPKIKFSTFSSLYEISQDKWTLKKDTVTYIKYAPGLRLIYGETEFRFSIIDLFCYKHWLKVKDKQDKQEEILKIMDEILAEAKKKLGD